MKIDLKDLTYEELTALLAELQMEPFRAKQIFQWLYRRNVDNINAMTDISQPMRARLARVASISSFLPEKTMTSIDGSKKLLFKSADNKGIESVLIPEKKHLTLCISTQIGCPAGCRFCFTGRNGLVRNLLPSEIVNQVSAVLQTEGSRQKLPNIVFMGMGEPLANYENTLKSIRTLLNPWGFNFSHRKITVSTAGMIPQITRLGRDLPVNLAISLNAPNDRIRDYLMPLNKKFPLRDLLRAAKAFPLPSRKRITFEYILIKDVNDAPEHALELAKLLKNIPCKINLIPFNQHPAVDLKPSLEPQIHRFQAILHEHHFTAPIRRSKGPDIAAACGQLGDGIHKSDRRLQNS